MTGKSIPDPIEGEVLPPFNPDSSPDRPVFQIDAKSTGLDVPEPSASMMVRKGRYKLIVHFGSREYYAVLDGKTVVELYDLENDPDEQADIAGDQPAISASLISELNRKLEREAGFTIDLASLPGSKI